VYVNRNPNRQESANNEVKDHVEEQDYNDTLGLYHIYYVSGGRVHRAVFNAMYSECSSDLCFGPFTRTL